ncbi:MAG: hypothetical protein IT445_19940 [Phycisphaeraceae bacterium]|nr:hypothetical protein [Phycisphaeraceae bacterium]
MSRILCLWMCLLPTANAAMVFAQDDIADVPAERMQVPDQPRMLFTLIGHDAEKKPPEDGYGLLLVLPGGDGGEDFQPFIQRIHKHAAPPDCLTVQLIAVKWHDKQQVVWPTAISARHEKAEFTTEQFIDAVIEHLAVELAVDRDRIFTLSWSSGGPAAYAAALREKTPVTGSFIAMSVFKPDHLPPLKNAEGRPFYLLQSPEDRVTPYRFAQWADEALRRNKAAVELVRYEGGHGWRGDVFGMIRTGLAWLDQQQDADEQEPAAAEDQGSKLSHG